MKLTDLEAYFVRWRQEAPTPEEIALNPQWPPGHKCDWFSPVPTLAEAHGVHFICPKSFVAGAQHHICVYFSGSPVPPRLGVNSEGKTVRWDASGSGLSDLTLKPSIMEEAGECLWHGFVTNGDAS